MKKFYFALLLCSLQLLYAQSDCITALPACGNSSISYTPTGSGTVQEDLMGCLLSDEHYSVWYSFTVATSGTLVFTIDPANYTDDYDFGVYGPNLTCGNLGAPIRCNYSGADGQTGLSLTVAANNSAVDGAWSGYMNVLAGETYYLVVDNYLSTADGFSLMWGGTATLSSAFNDTSLAPNQFNEPNQITICSFPTLFDFSTLNSHILNGNANFQVTYHNNANDALLGTNPITTPVNVTAADSYYYSIHYVHPTDPNSTLNKCRKTGEVEFILGNIITSNDTLVSCPNQSGLGTFNLSTATIYGAAGTTFQYYTSLADLNAGTNAITNPTTYQSIERTIYVKTTTQDGCTDSNATITLQLKPLETHDVTLFTCNNNGAGTGIFNLTIANVYTGADAATATYKYFKTIADLNNNTNAISNPAAYTSTEGQVYVLVVTESGCANKEAIITLTFNQSVTVKEATLRSCFLEDDHTTASFDLTTADVSDDTPVVKMYYRSLADALSNSNPIMNPSDYVSTDGAAYIKVTNNASCFSIAKVNLQVIKPTYSPILKDKYICADTRTTLDAGPGFASYLWSTGATTASISGVGVGQYWVKLQTGDCYTIHKVEVKVAQMPLITDVDIKNNSATVNAAGGIPPYQYSIDGVTWQDSNVFNNLTRGQQTFYVKDTQNCVPFSLELTVPNLINAITPNNDNVNDYVDYSDLAYKKNLVFQIFDRYGNKVFQGEKFNNYRWNGTHYDKKIVTGTYWYTISWNENNQENTPVKYTGWILVKNR